MMTVIYHRCGVLAAIQSTYLRPIQQNTFLSSFLQNKRLLHRKFPEEPLKASNHTVDDSLKVLESKYPEPRGTLNNIMAFVNKELKSTTHNLNISFKPVGNKSTSWICRCHLFWPSQASFSAISQTKREAARVASLKAIHWLLSEGKLEGHKPILFDQTTFKTVEKADVKISISEEDITKIENLVDTFEHNIKLIIENLSETHDLECSSKENISFDADELIKVQHERLINARNKLLLRRATFYGHDESVLKYLTERQNLPIYNFRKTIIQAVQDHQVVVIKGEPGCGKSTQVPQFLLEDFILRGRACDCNIIVTQPRRISAITLAEYVAAERGEQVGDVVGFTVRFNSKNPRPPGGSIRFCSSGILLRILQNDPELSNFSHIILDEAHERDVNTDLLMLLLRRLIASCPNKKLIIMSATINPELFQNYFTGAYALNIPGFTYSVRSYFLDDIEVPLTQTLESQEEASPRIIFEEVAKLLSWIHKNQPPGSILCFLPGWHEIRSLLKELKDVLDPQTTMLLPLHSRLSLEDQQRVFHSAPDGVRKIILSTNVAETSVTIDDVVYVVDTGLHKEERLSADKGMSVLDTRWVSQANVRQRRGRAGRVQPGLCYHLYSQRKFDTLPVFPVPELHRIPLQQVVLNLKTYDEHEKAAVVLSQMPEPPSSVSVLKAVEDLVNLGALSSDESLTPLGRRIARLSTHPKLSKALIYAAIFRCLNPILSITSILSADADLFTNSLEDKEEILSIKKRFDEFSDHFALLKIFENWSQLFMAEQFDEDELFCIKNMLRRNTMRLIYRIKQSSLEQLAESKVVAADESINSLDETDVSPEFVKVLLLTGSSYLFRRNWDKKSGRIKLNTPSLIMENGKRASLSSDSVCHRQKLLPSPFLAYFHSQESVLRRTTVVRDASVVSPLGLLLFSSNKLQIFDNAGVVSENHTHFRVVCEQREALILSRLRIIIEDVAQYFLKNEGIATGQDHDNVSQFRDKLVRVLSDMFANSLKHKSPR